MTTFTSFTFPESTTMPPELRHSIAEIDTLAEIKITIALLDAYARGVSRRADMLSADLSGLSGATTGRVLPPCSAKKARTVVKSGRAESDGWTRNDVTSSGKDDE